MEDEPRIMKQYKGNHCCSCTNYREKGMESGEESVFVSFFLADQKIASSWEKKERKKKKAFWGIL